MIRNLILALSATAWLGTVAVSPAWAQSLDGKVMWQPATHAYSEGEVKSVALAVVEVKRINDVYLPRLQAAASPAEQAGVREAASTEMKRAIEKHISIDKYTEIVTEARLDENLADRIRRHMANADAR